MILKAISRFGVCLLGIIFIFSSLGAAFAVEPTPSPTPGYELDDGHAAIDEALMSYYIWLCMRAWGIQISYQDSLEWQQSVSDQIVTWVMEYLSNLPSSYSINQWIAPWQSSFDYWGNYQFNNSALEDIQDFVDWLMTKFGITDNSTIVINPTYSVNGYTAYKIGSFYNCAFPDGTTSNYYEAIELTQTWGNNPIEYYAVGLRGNDWYVIFLESTGQAEIRTKYADYNNEVHGTGGIYTNSVWNTNSVGTAYQNIGGLFYTVNGEPLIPNGQNFRGTASEFDTFIDNMRLVQEGNSAFVTASILLPFDDPDYTDGDSITIIEDKPEYLVIEWNGEVTVSNLPAIVSTGSIPTPGDELNPGLVNAWHPISTLIEMTADSMGLLIGIVYEFPEEVLIPIFAVLGGIIIFGIIHAMKEH